LFGRRAWRVLASLVVLFSAAASYYMTFLNVVIGYGIIASVMTTDIDLSKEVVGWQLFAWVAIVSVMPLLSIWNNRCRYTLLRQLRTRGHRMQSVALVVMAALLVGGPFACWICSKRKKNGPRAWTCRAMAAWSRTPICLPTGFLRWAVRLGAGGRVVGSSLLDQPGGEIQLCRAGRHQ
jgi:KDO II ethanolaminephosphotransferase